ncbi:hypothetical protein FQR65_LT19744 [Abscondita terminalis]|nr:hypothetical protein FQR65_LT19744 [Abscondita terminalis]
MVRAKANPTLNNSDPENAFTFLSYLNREQYGDEPLMKADIQNDQQGNGTITEGKLDLRYQAAVDQMHVGGQKALPTSVITDPSYNKYFFLPLIIGLIGAFWHFGRRQRDAGIVGLLFFFTGLAIVLYLNQSPLQPRERDYAYAGSFYAFSIWIGLGVVAIADFLRKKVDPKLAGYMATAICIIGGPVILIAQNWK